MHPGFLKINFQAPTSLDEFGTVTYGLKPHPCVCKPFSTNFLATSIPGSLAPAPVAAQ